MGERGLNPNSILTLGAVGLGAYLLYRFFKGGAVEGAGTFVSGAAGAVEGTGAIVGSIASGVGQDLQTFGNVAQQAAPIIERATGIEPFQTIRNLEQGPIATSPVGDIVGGTSPLGLGAGGLSVDFIGPIKRQLAKSQSSSIVQQFLHPTSTIKDVIAWVKAPPVSPVLSKFLPDTYQGAKSTGADSVGSNKVTTTKSQTNSSAKSPEKTASYNAARGGIVTSDNKFYPTTNKNWVPAGYKKK